jgi:serine protease Do
MTKFKKSLAVFALAGASIAAWEGGSTLVEDVQFARAEQQVQNTREQLQSVQDLSTVFRNIGKATEPSVVEIEVHKTIKGARRRMLPNDDFLRRFFEQHGMGDQMQPLQPFPKAPNDQGDNGDNNDDNNGDNNAPDEGGDLEQIGTGSGVIIEADGKDGYILTNNHVAGGATEMTITLSDGRTITNGKVLGADPKSDLAVVKISADHLIPAKWGDSDQMDRGDWVLAFGAPFGYVGSMTHGIVSALNRQAGILGSQGYEDFIQVDAPINPGNSGGPLVNIHGDVIGINTAIATRSGGFQGIGFAIPSNQAKVIYQMLKDKGKVTRGWLGVSIEDVHRDPGLAKSFGYTQDTGVIVQQVLQGTPSTGKLQPGDIITAVNDKAVENVQELRNEIARTVPGTNAKVQVFRNNKPTDVTITIGEQPANVLALGPGGNGIAPKAGNAEAGEALGMRLANVTDELAQKYGLGETRQGALVTSVEPRSLAAKAGLQPGDLITRVGSENVTNANDAADAIGKQDVAKGIRLYITNKEGSRFVFIQKAGQ